MLFFKRAPPPPVPAKYAAAAEDPSSIGNILLRMGALTPQQLQAAIGQKNRFDEVLLGSLLQQMGFVACKDVATALKIQGQMRQGSALSAELDVLQVKMDESATHAKQLATSISNVRSRRERRARDNIDCVPVPRVLAKAGS